MKRANWVLALCAVCGIILAGTAAAVETYWELDGNAAAGWLGTTNVNPLTLKVNNTVGWRLLKSTGTPNVVGGYSGNTVSAIEGAMIGGGGFGVNPNKVTGAFGTVAGGVKNSAGDRAAIAGGSSNTASGIRSAIGGGYANLASGQYATVGGGSYNGAKADYTTVSGGGPGDLQNPTTSGNRATDTYCTVGGGGANVAGNDDATLDNANWATVGGGGYNFAYALSATVGGGWNNMAMAQYATASGGIANQVYGRAGTIAGGHNNMVNASYGTVGGGRINLVSGEFATVSGGGPDLNDGQTGFLTRNKATDNFCTVGGGSNNLAGDDDGGNTTAPYATVAGGHQNDATAESSTVGGGWWNLATAPFATVAGGGAALQPGKADFWVSNRATDQYCTVGGGGANLAGSDDQNPGTAIIATVGGGQFNVADHFAATVSGGYNNQASGNYATVPGGVANRAQGQYSFAAGLSARAIADGAFAWADSTGALFTNSTTNRFAVRASGGVYLYTNAEATTGVYVGAGGTGWDVISDRNAKENFTEVKATDVLDKVAALPISTWNLKDGDTKVRHMGPMAQDLHAAFGLGDSDKSINSVDADGISLAAIQGLNQRVQEQAAQIKTLKSELDTLKAMIAQNAAK